ncbi:hypothetical protein EAG_09854 [Camponotus floridanus]|uniref:Uncharacterized protein n=1 Tax=Camponotus floridanus TaxID=104421 RepID=E1ZX48_CAMFO|nr:hypothetical protein EAG_09854 [Camponotus floridanus]
MRRHRTGSLARTVVRDACGSAFVRSCRYDCRYKASTNAIFDSAMINSVSVVSREQLRFLVTIEKFLSHLECNRKEAVCLFRSSIKKKKQAVQFLACRILIEGSRKEIATSRKMDSHDSSAKFPHRDSRLDLRGTPRAIITAAKRIAMIMIEYPLCSGTRKVRVIESAKRTTSRESLRKREKGRERERYIYSWNKTERNGGGMEWSMVWSMLQCRDVQNILKIFDKVLKDALYVQSEQKVAEINIDEYIYFWCILTYRKRLNSYLAGSNSASLRSSFLRCRSVESATRSGMSVGSGGRAPFKRTTQSTLSITKKSSEKQFYNERVSQLSSVIFQRQIPRII